MVEIKAGFSWDITANLLGQTGFFDNSLSVFILHLSRHASILKESTVTKAPSPETRRQNERRNVGTVVGK